MIYSHPGLEFSATLVNAPAGLVGALGVRVDTTAGAAAVARTVAGIKEVPADSGIYTVTLEAPADEGFYLVIWDDGGEPPAFTSEELRVTGAPVEANPLPGAGAYTPTPKDVARAIRSRTYTGDAATVEDALTGGELAGDFNEQTNPTKAQVDEHIADAIDDLLALFTAGAFPERCWGAVKRAATLKAALAVEIANFEGGSSEGSPYLQLRIDAAAAEKRLISRAEVLDAFGIRFPEPPAPEKPEDEVQ